MNLAPVSRKGKAYTHSVVDKDGNVSKIGDEKFRIDGDQVIQVGKEPITVKSDTRGPTRHVDGAVDVGQESNEFLITPEKVEARQAELERESTASDADIDARLKSGEINEEQAKQEIQEQSDKNFGAEQLAEEYELRTLPILRARLDVLRAFQAGLGEVAKKSKKISDLVDSMGAAVKRIKGGANIKRGAYAAMAEPSAHELELEERLFGPEFDGVRAEAKKIRGELTELRGEIRQRKEEIKAHREEIKAHREEIAELDRDPKPYNAQEIGKLEKEIGTLEGKIGKLEKEITKFEGTIKRRESPRGKAATRNKLNELEKDILALSKKRQELEDARAKEFLRVKAISASQEADYLAKENAEKDINPVPFPLNRGLEGTEGGAKGRETKRLLNESLDDLVTRFQELKKGEALKSLLKTAEKSGKVKAVRRAAFDELNEVQRQIRKIEAALTSYERDTVKYGLDVQMTITEDGDIVPLSGTDFAKEYEQDITNRNPDAGRQGDRDLTDTTTPQRSSKPGKTSDVRAKLNIKLDKNMAPVVKMLRWAREHLGLEGTSLSVIDENGLEKMIASLEKGLKNWDARIAKEVKKRGLNKKDKTQFLVQQKENHDIYVLKLKRLKGAREVLDRGGIIYNDDFNDKKGVDRSWARIPIMILSTKTKAVKDAEGNIVQPSRVLSGEERLDTMLHEFGHFVQRVSMDQIIAQAQDQGPNSDAAKVVESIFGRVDWAQKYDRESPERRTGETKKAFTARVKEHNERVKLSETRVADQAEAREWFANMLVYWASTKEAPKTAVEHFFKKAAEKLRAWFDRVTKEMKAYKGSNEYLKVREDARRKAKKNLTRWRGVKTKAEKTLTTKGNMKILSGEEKIALDKEVAKALGHIQRIEEDLHALETESQEAQSLEGGREKSFMQFMDAMAGRGQPNSRAIRRGKKVFTERQRIQTRHNRLLESLGQTLQEQISWLDSKVAVLEGPAKVKFAKRVAKVKQRLHKGHAATRKQYAKARDTALASFDKEWGEIMTQAKMAGKPVPRSLDKTRELVESLAFSMHSRPRSDGVLGDRYFGEEIMGRAKAKVEAGVTRTRSSRGGAWTESQVSNLWGKVAQRGSLMVQAVDGRLKGMKSSADTPSVTATFIASLFRWDMGTVGIGSNTIPDTVTRIKRRIQPMMQKSLDTMPVVPHLIERLKNPEASKEDLALLKEITEGLIKHQSVKLKDLDVSDRARTEIGKVRQYFKEVYSTSVSGTGGATVGEMLNIREVENYFPMILDIEKFSNPERKEYILRAIGKDKAFNFIDADGQWLEHGEANAEKVYNNIITAEGQTDPSIIMKPDVLGPQFMGKLHREFSPELQSDLAEFYHDNVYQIMVGYTDALAKRLAWQIHVGGYEQDKSGRFVLREARSEHETVADRLMYSPVARLNWMLNNAVELGDLKAEDAIWIREVAIPAYQGNLGADMSPGIRKAVAWTKTYLSVSILAGATFTSIPDLAGIYIRLGAYADANRSYEGIKELFKLATDSGYRKEAARYANVLLTVHDDFVDHALANTTAIGYTPAPILKVNDAFFKVIMLKQWTDFTRILATNIAKDDIKWLYGENTAEANEKLGRLGLERRDVEAWIDAGADSNHLTQQEYDYANPRIAIALNRWVDQAVIRPSATLRPGRWGSDHRMAFSWYLNDFVWGFYETVMKQAYQGFKDQKGFAKVLPPLMLAATVLPLAALGYELRKLIFGKLPAAALDTRDVTRELHGLDYLAEVFRRSGLMGPLQMYDDYATDRQRGKSAILNLGGVLPEKFLDLIDNPERTMWKTNPITGTSPTLRAYFKDQLE